MASVILISLILGPLVIAFLLKSNAALAFLSLAAGALMAIYSARDISRLLERLVRIFWSESDISLAIILGLVILTLVLTRKAVPRPKFIFHIVPSLGSGGLLALLVIPWLNSSLQTQAYRTALWQNTQKYQAIIIGAGSITSLVVVWFGNLGGGHKRSKKHK